MLRNLLDRLTGGGEQQRLDAFLEELIGLTARMQGVGQPDTAERARWRDLVMHVSFGRLSQEDVRDWRRYLDPMRQRHRDVEAMALWWVCAVDRRIQAVRAAAQRQQQRYSHLLNPIIPLLAFLWLARPSNTAEVIQAMLREQLGFLTANPGLQGAEERDAVTAPVALLRALDDDLTRGRVLLTEVVAAHATVRQAQPIHRWSVFQQMCDKVVATYGVPLVEAGLLSEAEFDAMLVEFPDHTRHVGQKRVQEHARWHDACDAAYDRCMQRVLAGDQEGMAVISSYPFSRDGFSRFLAACQVLEQHPAAKFDLEPWGSNNKPLPWAVRLLRSQPAPGPADRTRVAELGQFSAGTLINASLLAPSWAVLAEPHLDWPGWGQMVRWLARYGGPAPWSDAAPQPSADEEDEDGAAVDRVALEEAFQAMGEKRYKQLLKHRVARGLYRNGLFYAEAVLGRNAAEVEEKYLKRSKQAVVALGMLPDEGDALQRYLALRRFAKEARQFGAKRQASEQLAVERALENLAVTMGYEDRAQLEWSMEAQLVEEIDPGRRWAIGEYTVWLEADEAATVNVERDGKGLKSVPPAVRQAEEYAEVKEAREQLKAQWDRVRRRLELAMALGEVMDREAFAPALVTPAGRAMLPNLVMRCWLPGSDEPADSLGPAEGAERYQVAHALDLAAAGTLAQWQARLVAERRQQPFNQLFRECYAATAAESQGENHDCRRFQGRKVRVGTLAEKLKRRNWHMGYEGDLERRLPGRNHVSLWFEDGAAYMGALEILTAGLLNFYPAAVGRVHPRDFSEALRDVDLATRAAAPEQPPVSPEALEARAALARALGCAVEGEYALGRGWKLHLGTGSAFGASGDAMELRKTDLPADFPYADRDPATADVMARLFELVRRK